MAITLSNNVNAALDICAPVKTFKISPAFVPGLKPETKSIMVERDRARGEIKTKTTPGEKHIMLEKYRKLRNRATTMIKNDKLAENGKRNDEAKNEFWPRLKRTGRGIILSF